MPGRTKTVIGGTTITIATLNLPAWSGRCAGRMEVINFQDPDEDETTELEPPSPCREIL